MGRTRLLCLLLVPTIVVAFLPGLFHLRHASGDTPVADYAVYCIGDSLTAADYFEAELGTLLGASFTVVNKGVGGDTTSGMLKRFKADILDYGPDSVVIWGGVNDISWSSLSLATSKSNLQSMYTQAHNANIKVIAISMSPWKGTSSWTIAKQVSTDSLHDWIMNTAINVDYRVEVYDSLEDGYTDCLLPDYDRGDHLHLNSTGGAVVGQVIYDAVDFVSLNAQPRNVLPANGATAMSLTPSLQSTAFSDPGVGDSHSASQWQVTSTSGNYSSSVYDSGTDASNLTSITMPSGELHYSITYYWHVRHQANYDAWSQWSTETSFRTTHAEAPTLVSPTNGATVTGTSVTFEWSAVDDTVSYRLIVSTSTNPLDTTKRKISTLVGDVTSYTDAGYLANGTKYYWWVWAYDANGIQSVWSEVSVNGRCFTNAATYIAAPTLLSPANGVSVSGTSVTFEWSAVAGAVNYRLVVSTSSDILNQMAKKTIVNVGTSTSYTDTGYLAKATKYYWWVFAYNDAGNQSPWSQVSANGRWFTNTA